MSETLPKNLVSNILKLKERKNIVKEAERLGLEYERKYWGCGQSTILAILDSLDLRNPDVFKSLSGFGAGIGLTNKSTCGALIGSIAAISYIFGRDIKKLEELDRGILCYRISRKMVNMFESKYGTLDCFKLQEKLMGRYYNLWDERDFALFEEAGGHRDKCPSIVSWCSGKAVELILEFASGGGK